ncbi:MAG: hypothetical protein ACP5JN_04085, partial [Candidatus Micrarchaeia archaeon]
LASVTNTVVVAQNNTLSASSTGNPGSSYYGYPVSITFTGTPTIRHQAKWSLYVNGALYGTTNSSITYYEQFAPPNIYNFVFNLTNDPNYTPVTYKTTLVINWPPTGVSGSATTTVPTTSTVSTTIPTTSVTTTIPPTQAYNNVTSTVSASSPLVLTLPNAMATVNIYTTSASPAPIKAHIANVTSVAMSIPKPQQNYALVSAVNVSVNTTANVTILFTEHYPCSIPSSLIAPYMLKNNTWVPISNYTVNATMCTVSFYIPKDPIVGIFEKAPTTTTIISTSVPTTSILTTTIIQTPTPTPTQSSANTLVIIIGIIALIIIVIIALYYYKLTHKKR